MDTFPDFDMVTSGTSTPISTPYSSHRASRVSFNSRRSSRVEKPRSSHNSPRNVERRRTTSAVKKYATLEDHWDLMFGNKTKSEVLEDRDDSRPVSWHPSSNRFSSICQSPVEQSPFPGDSQHSLDDSVLPIQTSQDSMMAMSMASTPMAPEPYTVSSAWEQMMSSTPSTSMATYPAVPYDPMPYQLQQGLQQGLQHMAPATSNPSDEADFLPIQYPQDDSKLSPTPDNKSLKSGGKVLIGMGLYDPPENRPTFVGSTLLQGTGKGLKLEETFQPPSEQDNEDPVEDVGSDEEEEELPNPNATQSTEPEASVSVNMSGQSFLFEEDDAYANEWLFQQFRYPERVQGTTLGLSWAA
jgi:hypothetical protein